MPETYFITHTPQGADYARTVTYAESLGEAYQNLLEIMQQEVGENVTCSITMIDAITPILVTPAHGFYSIVKGDD